MSMGCSSSCCTAPCHRYTERHGARMFTQAATFFATSSSASRSAAVRSGRLVSTKSVLMTQSLLHRWIAKPHAEDDLQAPVVEPPRFAHEFQRRRWDERGDLAARHARRARQAGMIGDPI